MYHVHTSVCGKSWCRRRSSFSRVRSRADRPGWTVYRSGPIGSFVVPTPSMVIFAISALVGRWSDRCNPRESALGRYVLKSCFSKGECHRERTRQHVERRRRYHARKGDGTHKFCAFASAKKTTNPRRKRPHQRIRCPNGCFRFQRPGCGVKDILGKRTE